MLPELNDHPFIAIDEGLCFGEMDFLCLNDKQDGKRKFSVKALTDCDLLLLSKANLYCADAEFEDIVEELFNHSDVRLKAALELRSTIRAKIESLSMMGTHSKIGGLCTQLQQTTLRKIDEETKAISSSSEEMQSEEEERKMALA